MYIYIGKWVTVAISRSGTQLLTSLLASHNQLTSHDEYLLDYNMLNWRKNTTNHNDFWLKMEDNTGYNLKYSYFEENNQFELNDLDNKNIIHLVRKNIFKNCISEYINCNRDKLGRTHKEVVCDNIYDIKFEIPKQELINLMKNRQETVLKYYNLFKNKKYNCLTVFYEDLIDSKINDENKCYMNKETQHKILNFINVEQQTLSSEMKKLNPPDYESYILNWNEIKHLKNLDIFSDLNNI